MAPVLPVLDLKSDAVASELRRACEHDGFFYIAHHGVPSELLAEVRARARSFFARPLEEKLELHFEKAQKQRGYIPLRAESTDPNAVGDEKEALDFTYPIPPEGVRDAVAVAHRMYGENLWPRAMPGFRPAIESYLDEMIRLGRRLFEIFAESRGPDYRRIRCRLSGARRSFGASSPCRRSKRSPSRLRQRRARAAL